MMEENVVHARFVLSEDTLTKAKFCSPFLLSQNIFERNLHLYTG